MFRPLLVSVALFCAGVAQAADESSGLLLDRVVAIVNEGIVTESELNDEVRSVVAGLRQRNAGMPSDEVIRRQVLDRLVLQELQVQRADRIGLRITDEQLNDTIAEIAQHNGLTLAQLPAALAADGVNYASYRENVRKELTIRGLRQREVLSNINVTPRELDQFMERLRRLPDEGSEYDVSHILIAIPPDATQAQVDELAQQAQQIHARTATEDFASLAVTYSNSRTALEGGALGWRPGADLPPSLSDTIVALKPGEVSRPVEQAGIGFHIVKLNAVRSAQGDSIQAQNHARHILMTTNELQDNATVELRLEGIRERILNGEDFAVFASSLSEDPGSAVNGGDLGWAGPGSFVPEFEQALGALQENEISLPFRTQFGWHIVQLLGKRQFDTTEDALRQRAFIQLRESKAEEEVELWLRRMRDEAFVDTNV